KYAFDSDIQEYLISKYIDYFTARIDIKLLGKLSQSFLIESCSDNSASISKQKWFLSDGYGFIVFSYAQNISIVLKIKDNGKLLLSLKGIDKKDAKGKKIPIWIDYKKFEVCNNQILNKVVSAWHDCPIDYQKNVKSGDIVWIHIEWGVHCDTRKII
ncbi:MAG: hypothetical protein K5752_07480, partial [Succinivibrionaceae bacterium]|nr:hypothetical protein [Succinivibrionaceae bacterium]